MGCVPMPRFSARKIKDLFTKSDAAKTKAEKGKHLEDLAVYLFEMVPGISMTARDKKNTYDTEEIDVALWNEQHARGFKTLNFLILVECKNWSSPVGSMEVNWFLTKIKNRALDFGILIAANGITGSDEDKKQAHDVVSKSLAEGVRMILLTRDEIVALTDSDELVRTVKRKLCELTVSGTVWP
jgi:Restriction endonuclease